MLFCGAALAYEMLPDGAKMQNQEWHSLNGNDWAFRKENIK